MVCYWSVNTLAREYIHWWFLLFPVLLPVQQTYYPFLSIKLLDPIGGENVEIFKKNNLTYNIVTSAIVLPTFIGGTPLTR